MELDRLAYQAHENGDIQKEIELRQKLSRDALINYSQHPKDPGRWNRWAIVAENDLPLALLLEGKHDWSSAEEIYRRNQSLLAHERLAGNDIKSENQLHLAHLLAREGKESEAIATCSYWKNRVKRVGDEAVSAVKYSIPHPSIYDTPEVKIAAWDLACGKPEEGLKLLSGQIEAHPHMLISFTVLSRYYLANGEFEKALTTEREGVSALTQK